MESPEAPPAGATCPPHHWLIEGEAPTQHWTCQRCGAQREYEERAEEERWRPWRGVSDTSRPPPPAFGR